MNIIFHETTEHFYLSEGDYLFKVEMVVTDPEYAGEGFGKDKDLTIYADKEIPEEDKDILIEKVTKCVMGHFNKYKSYLNN